MLDVMLPMFSNTARCALLLLLLGVGCGQPTPSADAGANNEPNNSTPDMGGEDLVEDRPATRLKVATFNVSRLFDTVCDSNNCGDAQDFERQLSDAEFAFKIDQIGGALEDLDADIVSLQEVENQDCLDALLAERPEYDFGALGEIGGTATLDVAIIGRGLTHIETRTHRANTELPLESGGTQRFARELLEVHFDLDGERIVVFSAHFKARRNDDPEWRLAEAEGARAIAEATQEEFPNAFVYIGGDLNDEPGTAPLDAMTSNDGLVSVTRELDEDDVWTFSFGQDRIVIDHILFVPQNNGALVDGLTEVVRDASGGLGGSDHAGLRTEFDIFTD